MQEQKGKMEKNDWFMLHFVAGFFDLLGIVCLPIDLLLAGWAGFIVNLIAGMTFLFWANQWKDKGLGAKFFTTLLISFCLEEFTPIIIPYFGGLLMDIIPTWSAMIIRAKANYGKSITSVLTSTATQGINKKIAGSGLTQRQQYWAKQATGTALDLAYGKDISGVAIGALERDRGERTKDSTTESAGEATRERPIVGDEIRPQVAPNLTPQTQS